MILMGSQAARLRGDLPEWSDPTLTDYDLVGTREEFEDLFLRCTLAHADTIRVDRGGGRMAIRVPLDGGRILIDYLTDEIESSKRLALIHDHEPGELFGMPCDVISAVTECVIKSVMSEFPHHPKTARWLEHWTALVGDQPLSSAHADFRDQLHAEYAEKFI